MDTAVIVTAPEVSALRDADRIISVMEDSEIEDIRLVLNRIRPDLMHKGIMMNADDCVDMLQIPVLGIVPEDDELKIAALRGELAVENNASRAGEAFTNIAKRIMGYEVPIMEFEVKKSFFGRLRQILNG